jgi:hypothetical protein
LIRAPGSGNLHKVSILGLLKYSDRLFWLRICSVGPASDTTASDLHDGVT